MREKAVYWAFVSMCFLACQAKGPSGPEMEAPAPEVAPAAPQVPGAAEQAPQALAPPPSFGVEAAGGLYTLSHQEQVAFSVEVAKWKGDRQAAVSMNYDAPWGLHPDHSLATDAVLERGLRMDLEVVSEIFEQEHLNHLTDFYREEFMPQGIRFFGHGHAHSLHDTMEFDEAYASFKRNFDLMEEWGLEPKVYAYPGSSGLRLSTQLANQAAGFVAARGSVTDREKYYICPGEETEPENWFYLPSVVMGTTYPSMVHDHAELAPILDRNLDEGAWIILMYHAVGSPEGWGYYPLAEFVQDLDQIDDERVWNGNMDSVTLYIQERNRFRVELLGIREEEDGLRYELRFTDGLDNDFFDEPLTLIFNFEGERSVERVRFDPPLGALSEFDVVNNRMQLDAVPDERRYVMYVE